MKTFKHKMTFISVVIAVAGNHKYVCLCFSHNVDFYHTTYAHTIR